MTALTIIHSQNKHATDHFHSRTKTCQNDSLDSIQHGFSQGWATPVHATRMDEAARATRAALGQGGFQAEESRVLAG